MATKKVYGSVDEYERKLSRVMERLGVESYQYDWTRKSAFVRFIYKGQSYQFDHDIEKASQAGKKLTYGTDAFAQLVLTLEDLARMSERGIYDFGTWVSGMKCLPEKVLLPKCFQILGIDGEDGMGVPNEETIRKAYQTKRKTSHPDNGGNAELFHQVQAAYQECLIYIQKKGRVVKNDFNSYTTRT